LPWGTAPPFFAALKKQATDAAYTTVRYDMADEKGETRRQRNERFGAPSPEVEIPHQLLHVWDWFWELSARRRSGPEALTFADIGEWSRLRQVDLQPIEVEFLMAMDDAYLKAVREDQEAARQRALDESRSR